MSGARPAIGTGWGPMRGRLRLTVQAAAAVMLAGVLLPVVSTPATAAGVTWAQLDLGRLTGCGVRTDSSLWCWGANDLGQLGDGSTVDRRAGVPVGQPTGWSSVAVGTGSSCAVRIDGGLWCWGVNQFGEVGDGTTAARTSPVRVGTVSTWRQVSVGDAQACATRSDASLWCWGSNASGSIGDGTQVDSAVPVRVTGSWSQVTAHGSGVCGIRTDATLWCWGSNGSGQLGTGSPDALSGVPVQVGTTADWRSVTNSEAHTCGTRTDGSLWCWGGNLSGQLGLGSTADLETRPVRVGTATDWTTASAGGLTTCGTRGAGTLWCWGDNLTGAVGDGTTSTRRAPVQVRVPGVTWSGVAVADDGRLGAVCGLDPTGTGRCWGSNVQGQLGTGSANPYGSLAVLAPRPVAAATGWRQSTAALASFGCGLRTDGSLWCWGWSRDGALGVPRTVPQYRPVRVGVATWLQVAAGNAHTCAIRSDRTLWCWGAGFDGQLGDGGAAARRAPVQIGTATWASVDAGLDHTCGVQTDGSLWCWGANTEGQVGTGAGVVRIPTRVGAATDWTSVTTGFRFSCGIQGGGPAGGRLSCWGTGFAGQLGNGGTGTRFAPTPVSPATGWTAVSAGGASTCGVRVGGAASCWGDNGRGQVGDGTLTNRSLPVPLPMPVATGWATVSAGNDHTCATQGDGSLWCWGDTTGGQAGGVDGFRQRPQRIGSRTGWAWAEAGAQFSCAGRTDGALLCWGYDALGQLGMPVPIGNRPLV